MAERLNSSNQGKLALQSSGVQASDPVGAQLGASGAVMKQTAEFMDLDTIRTATELTGEVYDERGFLGGLASETTASRQAQIQQAIFNVNNTKYKNLRELREFDEFSDDIYDTGLTADYY
jgi:hypothetical protein